jgi:hypothetical protein
MLPILAQAAPAPDVLASWVAVLFYLGGILAMLVGVAVGVKRLRAPEQQQAIVSPQPLQVQQAHEYVSKPELTTVETRLGSEIHQLHGRISGVRNELGGKIDAIDARIDAIPQRVITLLRDTQQLHKSS